MASLAQGPFSMSTITSPQVQLRRLKLTRTPNVLHPQPLTRIRMKHLPVCCTKLFSTEPSLVPYPPTEDDDGKRFLNKTPNIFETLKSEDTAEIKAVSTEQLKETGNQPSMPFQFLKWPLWVIGPALLLTTGMVPTLWIPISSVFLGPNIASFLSLVGLDCVFNLGATLFLLMADACARPKTLSSGDGKSKAPLSYRFWNLVATISGFAIPLIMLFGSEKGVLQPQLPLISFAVLLGPYLLLLAVQFLTEMLTWHWQSPVWLVTPVVYEAYRVLQLMRGLKLGVELSSPAWVMHTIKGLVCWWVLILGLQLMRVAWFAGFSARPRQQQSSAPADG